MSVTRAGMGHGVTYVMHTGQELTVTNVQRDGLVQTVIRVLKAGQDLTVIHVMLAGVVSTVRSVSTQNTCTHINEKNVNVLNFFQVDENYGVECNVICLFDIIYI